MNADEAVRHLRLMARPLILQRFSRDSCIVSTAIACEFMRWAGVRARPIEVEVMAYNACAVEQLERGVMHDDWPDEAWGVAIMQNTPTTKPGRWKGAHLCALVENETLLDLSADQFSRPLRRMNVPGPIVLPWDGTLTKAINDEDGTLVVYRRVEKPDPSFRSSPDWRLKERRNDIVSELIRLARLLGAKQ